ALGIADRAYVLVSGSIEQEGHASELRDDERVRAAYLGP
ncbi:MAG: branched-chain amino acid ABC transporter ATP-binding protein, partial [Cyanobacteriota bacterium]|nr:branched-chain amino acid ABC transporter ATP-binding protein [Cyanobacteriota bacterium]MEB3275857.1 branched-chain amino acid ABC transporter ATP-binding protein [Cyanobacteriota bacterium]